MPTSRSVTSKQHNKFLKYGKSIDDKISSSVHIQNLLDDLDSTTCTKDIQYLVDAIDQAIGSIIQTEDNRFRARPALIAWSPIYKEKLLLRNQAKYYLNQYQKHNILFPPIPAHIPTERPAIIQYLKNILLSTNTKLRHIEKNATFHRYKFLKQQLINAYDTNNIILQKRFKRILNAELRQEAFRFLTPIVKGTRPGSLDRVVTTKNGKTMETTDCDKIFQLILQRNKHHFAQSGTDKTPFTTKPLSDILPPLHSNHQTTNIFLQGNLSNFPSDLPKATKTLLTCLKAPDSIKTVPDTITTQQFIHGIKRIPEGKSSSNSGRNYSIYRALSHFPTSCSIIVLLINTCLRHTFF